MTQKELAEKIKVDQSAIALWETGKTAPRFHRLSEISAALSCSVDELVRADEEKDGE